jgi:hypothetical protein
MSTKPALINSHHLHTKIPSPRDKQNGATTLIIAAIKRISIRQNGNLIDRFFPVQRIDIKILSILNDIYNPTMYRMSFA